jgi:hypothetical protein
MAAGCAALHLDFDRYGFVLPVLPENLKEYIGINLDNAEAVTGRLTREPHRVSDIAAAGCEWALRHYAPVPTAQRFLDQCDAISKRT